MRSISKIISINNSSLVWKMSQSRIFKGAQIFVASAPTDAKNLILQVFDEGKTVDEKNASPIAVLFYYATANKTDAVWSIILNEAIPVQGLRFELTTTDTQTITVIVHTN